VRKADNLPPSCAVVTKSGNLNFLELSGPIQACNGTDLPLPFLRKAQRCVEILILPLHAHWRLYCGTDLHVGVNRSNFDHSSGMKQMYAPNTTLKMETESFGNSSTSRNVCPPR